MATPSLYVFHGDDSLALAEAVDELAAHLGPSTDFNYQRFSAAALEMDALTQACSTPPFLGERRLVVVDDAEALPKSLNEPLEALFAALPETTALVLVEQGTGGSFVQDWAAQHPGSAYMRQFVAPHGPAYVRWLQARAAERGGEIEPEAAQLLGHALEEDVWLSRQELDKLLDYVDRDRPISIADVEALTPSYGQQDVFAIVDAIGRSPGPIKRLQELIEQQGAGYVYAMIVRQFRLMLMARDALDRGVDPVSVLSVPAFVARKVSGQARSFSLDELRLVYRHLHELDVAVKRGEADLELDLVPLIAAVR